MTSRLYLIDAADGGLNLATHIFDAAGYGFWHRTPIVDRQLIIECNLSDADAATLDAIYTQQSEADVAAKIVASRTAIYVAPSGQAEATGDYDTPRTLDDALANCWHGQTIILRAGTYFVGDHQALTVDKNITIKNAEGETAIVNAGFNLTARVIMRGYGYGFVIINDDANRVSSQEGSGPTDISRTTLPIQIEHDNCTIINVRIYNASHISAFGASNLFMYGVINVLGGWDAPDRPHGPAFYAHHNGPISTLSNCIFGNPFAYTIAIGSAGGAQVGDYALTDVISFHGNDGGINIYTPAGGVQDITVSGLYSYGDGLRVGYHYSATDTNINAIITNCVMRPLGQGVRWCEWTNLDARNNIFDAPFYQARNIVGDSVVDHNQIGAPSYIYDGDVKIQPATFSDWQATGMDANSTVFEPSQALPSVKLTVNIYERDFANVAVHNWQQSPSVIVDVSDFAADGETIIVHNALDWSDTASFVVAGGAIVLPMQASDWSNPIPTGLSEPFHNLILPAFGAFIFQRA